MRPALLLAPLVLLAAVRPLAALPQLAPAFSGMARETAALRGVLLAQATAGDDRLAGFEARLQRLEEELRRLTGRLEELEYRQRQLERAAAAGASPPPAGAEPATAGAAPETLAAPPAAKAADGAAVPDGTGTAAASAAPVEPDAAAKKGYVLGTIPRDALRNPPAGDAGAEAAAAGGKAAAGEVAANAGASPEERYRAALALLEAGDFDAAEKAFSRFLEDFPDHPKAANAAFWLGETYFFRQDYATAAAVYARNYRTYGPEAPRAPDTLLKLGMALAAIGDRERACQTFAELGRRYPRAPAPVRQALERERAAIGCS